jgi:hypothetical protein
MKRAIVLSIVANLSLSTTASAQGEAASSDPQRLVGTWTLVSYVGEEVPSGARSNVMGPQAITARVQLFLSKYNLTR